MSAMDTKQRIDQIVKGHPVVLFMKGMPQMPSHPQINGADLTALVSYVRSLSQHQASN